MTGSAWVAGLAAAAAFAATRALLPQALEIIVRAGFAQPNFRGQPVPVSAGVAAAFIYVSVLLLWHAAQPDSLILHLAFVVCAMALAGFADDVWGDKSAQGLRGHGRLLLQGRWSTGAVKAVFGLLVGLAAARTAAGGVYGTLVGGVVIALAANAVNLLDVRPGRALKGAAFLHAALLAASWPAPLWLYVLPLWGVLAAYAPYDLRAKAMLGDGGANWIGAVAGVAAVSGLTPAGLAVAAAALVLLHVVAETESITGWIERVPLLRRLDEWGRE